MSFNKRLDEARKGYEKKDLKTTSQAHTPEHISKAIHDRYEEHGGGASQFLGDFVYGGLDGIITTFAVVSGVEGASLGANIILILGLANVFADGFSMAMGAFLSQRSEQEFYNKEYEREMWEVEHIPDGERAELPIRARFAAARQLRAFAVDVAIADRGLQRAVTGDAVQAGGAAPMPIGAEPGEIRRADRREAIEGVEGTIVGARGLRCARVMADALRKPKMLGPVPGGVAPCQLIAGADGLGPRPAGGVVVVIAHGLGAVEGGAAATRDETRERIIGVEVAGIEDGAPPGGLDVLDAVR